MSPRKAAVEQQWLSHEVTPSGLEVRYGVEPKRVYQVRRGPKGRWREVPSVTTVLGVLDKPALPWWGMRVGTQGVLTLFNIGLLKVLRTGQGVEVISCPTVEWVPRADGSGDKPVIDWERPLVAGVPQIEELLKISKLTVNHVRDAAGDRGQAVHDAFEAWAKEGLLPDPSIYPPTEAGYVLGLRRFLEASGARAVANEVMVGSAKHGYAGRYDIRIEYPNDVEIVVHHTPKRGPQHAPLYAGVYLDDLKTSKDVYPSHFKQLEAYEEASVECGYEPTLGRGVIHVDAQGNYKRVPSPARFADFKSTLSEWKQQQSLAKRTKESK